MSSNSDNSPPDVHPPMACDAPPAPDSAMESSIEADSSSPFEADSSSPPTITSATARVVSAPRTAAPVLSGPAATVSTVTAPTSTGAAASIAVRTGPASSALTVSAEAPLDHGNVFGVPLGLVQDLTGVLAALPLLPAEVGAAAPPHHPATGGSSSAPSTITPATGSRERGRRPISDDIFRPPRESEDRARIGEDDPLTPFEEAAEELAADIDALLATLSNARAARAPRVSDSTSDTTWTAPAYTRGAAPARRPVAAPVPGPLQPAGSPTSPPARPPARPASGFFGGAPARAARARATAGSPSPPKTPLEGVPFFDGLIDVEAWITTYQDANRAKPNNFKLEQFLSGRALLWFKRIAPVKGHLTARSVITLREHFGSQPILDQELTEAERQYNKSKQEGSVFSYAMTFRDVAKEYGQDVEEDATRQWFYYGLKEEVRKAVRVRDVHTSGFEGLVTEAVRVEMIQSPRGERTGVYASVCELEEQTRSLQEKLARIRIQGWI